MKQAVYAAALRWIPSVKRAVTVQYGRHTPSPAPALTLICAPLSVAKASVMALVTRCSAHLEDSPKLQRTEVQDRPLRQPHTLQQTELVGQKHSEVE